MMDHGSVTVRQCDRLRFVIRLTSAHLAVGILLMRSVQCGIRSNLMLVLAPS